MTSLDPHSHKLQLIVTAIAASLATATFLLSYDTLKKRKRRKHLEEDIKQSLAEFSTNSRLPTFGDQDDSLSSSLPLAYDEELMREQLARNYAFFSEESMAKIRNSRIVIVGVMLARS